MNRPVATAALLAAIIFFPSLTMAQVKRITLDNGVIQAEITPDIGGRLLGFSLHNEANLLKVGEAVIGHPKPAVHPDADYQPYFGHEVWAGPQSQWWVHQTLNARRAADRTIWPPDPYTTLATSKILKQTEHELLIQGLPSPISGLMFSKHFSLLKNKKNTLLLEVIAENIRSENIAWDIWFNTRVAADSQVYIPVASNTPIRNQAFDSEESKLRYQFNDGILSLDTSTLPQGQSIRRGKIFIQPSYGWLAVYRGRQLFIIQFEHQPAAAIHPEQGQIEVYGHFDINALDQGLLELEVHAPYKELAKSQSMRAHEQWTLIAYSGEASAEAQLEFLRSQAAALGLGGL
ncbi:MAG TPA: DUF4380 domain-containing protein [Cellvibrio sp.]|nr:DUF4380 domain-containing protein [Cellvibrio sp.]